MRDSRGQPVADYVLVAFPEDTKLWGAQSRFVQTTRPNSDGALSIKGLPPGRYLAAVVPALENGLQSDPAISNSFALARAVFAGRGPNAEPQSRNDAAISVIAWGLMADRPKNQDRAEARARRSARPRETRGFVGMVEATDAMVKAANVVFVGWQKPTPVW